MDFKQAKIDSLSLSDLISLSGYCEKQITFYEKGKSEHHQKQIIRYWGPISCMCTSEIGFRISELIDKIDYEL